MPPVFKVNISSETTQRETRLMMNGGRDEVISAQPLGENRVRLRALRGVGSTVRAKTHGGESLLSLGVYTLYTSCTPATRLFCNETIQLSLTSRYSDRSVHANSRLAPSGTGLGRRPGGTAANEVVVAATHTHTHFLSLTHTYIHSLSHTHTLSHIHTYTYTYTLSLTHTHTYSLTHTHTYTKPYLTTSKHSQRGN